MVLINYVALDMKFIDSFFLDLIKLRSEEFFDEKYFISVLYQIQIIIVKREIVSSHA